MKPTTIIRPLCYVLAVVLLLSACQPAEPSLTAPASGEMVHVLDSTDFYTIDATYALDPWDKSEEMKAWVTQIVDDRKEAWKTGGQLYNDEKEITVEFPDRAGMRYELVINCTRTESKDLGIVSYLYTLYEFTGGAHGMASVMTFNYTREGKLEAEQLLDMSEGKDIALSRVLANEAVKDEQLFDTQSMLMEGLGLAYLKDDGVTFDTDACGCDGFRFASNFENFTADDQGILVHFSNYQIGPYSAGLPEIRLTHAQIKPYLQQGFVK